jgi:hypothetical protein
MAAPVNPERPVFAGLSDDGLSGFAGNMNVPRFPPRARPCCVSSPVAVAAASKGGKSGIGIYAAQA